MLTAAVRDLHQNHPDQFETDVRTSCPDLWLNNPYLTPLDDDDPDVKSIDCHYPLIHSSNQKPFHFIHGFLQDLAEKLNIKIVPTAFHGDIHLSEAERKQASPLKEILGRDLPYWLIVSGGKYDFTTKWWPFRRYQHIVDHFKGKILFVQVGEKGHFHPPLNGVIDMCGKTNLRELVMWMHHAEGALCPITFLMHLAAAVETRSSNQGNRPCVVVAGGREPPHWEAYPGHQFIHTMGALPCCASGGCWRCRAIPLGDGDEKDKPENLCLDVVDKIPKCMHMIKTDHVIERINYYFQGGRAHWLNPEEYYAAKPFLTQIHRRMARIKCELRKPS